MKQTPKQLPQETYYLVEALRDLLQAEDNLLTAFGLIYGEKEEGQDHKTGGEKYYSRTLQDAIEDTKTSIRDQIGQSFELYLQGLLDDKKEGKVC